MISMISKIPQGYFDKFGALKRILGPFFKNVGDFPKNVGLFPKNVGLFLRNLRRFFFYLPVFFVLELRWNNPLVWRLWKQEVQNPCNVRAWYAPTHTHERTSQKDTPKSMTSCSMRKVNKCAHFCASEGREVASFAVKLLNSATNFSATRI